MICCLCKKFLLYVEDNIIYYLCLVEFDYKCLLSEYTSDDKKSIIIQQKKGTEEFDTAIFLIRIVLFYSKYNHLHTMCTVIFIYIHMYIYIYIYI
jgi:hypothetical protein